MGRMLDDQGAHCLGRNHDSLGICFVGNFDEGQPPMKQWTKGVFLVASLCRIFKIPIGNVFGHREAQINRTCPGKGFDLDYFREQVKDVL